MEAAPPYPSWSQEVFQLAHGGHLNSAHFAWSLPLPADNDYDKRIFGNFPACYVIQKISCKMIHAVDTIPCQR